MGNIDLVQRVLEKFQERLPSELAELEKLLACHDVEQIAYVAHRIKGTSATISAQGLRQAAAEIEDLGRAQQASEIPTALEHLRSQWRRFLACVPAMFLAVDASENGKTTDKGFTATSGQIPCAS